jgi:hypothetical protein
MSKRKAEFEVPEELKDFRNFVYLVWNYLNLPEPTPIQYDISSFLQHGPRRRTICAFRGVGKSFLTSAYAVWQLLLDPQKNILVVSASKARSDDFSTFVQRMIWEMPILAHLKPAESQRTSKIAFDVGPAKAAHAPSVKSVGITGQLTGSRADLIISDDAESLNNSATQGQRDKLSELVKEFEAIVKPGGEIVFLGTPQTDAGSLYHILPERGYTTRVWPARYPTERLRKRYGNTLAPKIEEDLRETPEIVGEPTDPRRFNAAELAEREASYGRSGFAQQFMLDPSLEDENKYPLRVRDLVIMDINPEKAPENLIWAGSADYRLPELPNVSFAGDHYHKPMVIDGEWLPYSGSVMAIDPSGRGKDETSFCVVKVLNGFMYVHECTGIAGGYGKEVLEKLAHEAKRHQVNLILVESNFGDGMFLELLKQHLRRIYPVTTEEVRHHVHKNKRIVDTLEPVMNQHKLVVSSSLIEADYESTLSLPPEKQNQYRLFWQMTRCTREKGALVHDDRLDVLSMAVKYWVEAAGRSAVEEMSARREELLQKELESIMNTLTFGERPQPDTWM